MHTKGPWVARSCPGNISDRYAKTIYSANDTSIPLVDVVLRGSGNEGDDARLIAAAPDLLEACRRALFWMEQCGELTAKDKIHAHISAAIKKATGE